MLSEKNSCTLTDALKNIDKACQKAGRTSGEVSLLAVSKNQAADRIMPLLKAGHRWFGENRVQEAIAKWPGLRAAYPNIRLHLIAPLQHNKIKQALKVFNVIESIDRPSLVLALGKAWKSSPCLPDKILIQVNTGREPQKSGVLIENLPALVKLCQEHALPLKGLMTIPPLEADPVPHFRLLASLARKHALPELSMGMSGDYCQAIAEGATWVRLGTTLWP